MADTEFSVKVDDEDIKLDLVDATLEQQNEANRIYNKAFADALKSGALLRAETDKVLKERGIWDDDKEEKLVSLQKEISQKLKVINGGNIKLWSDARSLALEVGDLRNDMRALLSERNNLDNNTVEAQAENMRFSYFVSACTVHNDSKQPYFASLADYRNSTSVVSIEAAQHYMDLLYGVGSDFEKGLPENKFMLKYGLCDDSLRLTNKEGEFVDREMRVTNEDGRYIDNGGNFVNIDGERLDEEGQLLVENLPFLDEDGEIIEAKEEALKVKEVEEDSTVEENTEQEKPIEV